MAKLPDADKLTLAYQTDVENLATVYNGLTSYQQSYIDSDTLATFVKLDGTMKSWYLTMRFRRFHPRTS